MVTRRSYGQQRMIRLQEAVKRSAFDLQPFRERRHRAVQQYVGRNYGADGNPVELHLNYVELFVATLLPKLIPAAPRAKIVSFASEFESVGHDYSLVVNDTIEHIGYQTAQERCVIDSLLGPVGCVKIGLAEDTPYEVDGYQVDANRPYIDHVNFNDLLCDTSATDWEACDFIGHRMTVDAEWVWSNKDYDTEARNYAHNFVRQQHDVNGTPLAGAIGGTGPGSQVSDANQWSYRTKCDLLELYLPYDAKGGVVLTGMLLDGVLYDRPLQVREFTGPAHEYGPFRFLNYYNVPGELMPLPPVSALLPLHDLLNSLYRKQNEGARAAKTIIACAMGSEEDAERVKDAEHMDVVPMDASSLQQIALGGPDQKLAAMILAIQGDLNKPTGGIETYAGLGAQSPTATQDEMLQATASERIRYLQARVEAHQRKCMKTIGELIWNDPTFRRQMTKRVDGVDMDIPFVWDESSREGASLPGDLSIDVVPYSAQRLTPGARDSVISKTLQELMPFAQDMAQQGVKLNYMKLLEERSRNFAMPELMGLIEPSEGLPEHNKEGKGPGHERTMAPNTSRTNIRESRSRATEGGQRADQAQRMWAGDNGNNGNGGDMARIG